MGYKFISVLDITQKVMWKSLMIQYELVYMGYDPDKKNHSMKNGGGGWYSISMSVGVSSHSGMGYGQKYQNIYILHAYLQPMMIFLKYLWFFVSDVQICVSHSKYGGSD